jgi:plastocyanin
VYITKAYDEHSTQDQKSHSLRLLGLVAALLLALLLLAACGSADGPSEPTAVEPIALSAAESTMTPTAEPTEPPTTEPTQPPATEPTTPPTVEPTEPPAAEPSAAPKAEPTAEPQTRTTPTPAPTSTTASGADVTPLVTVAHQQVLEGQVTIAEVVSAGPGWLVIHAQTDGKPGPILGYSPVTAGTNSNVAVHLDLSSVTTTLYAMLHTDAGVVGTWEFPGGADTPVTVNDQVVSSAFQLQVSSDDEAEVEMEDFQFKPKLLTIRVGTTVKFSNKDEAEHTATSDTGVWDSGYLAKGEEFYFTFTEPGEYPYYCIPHGAPGGQGMSATIIVLP